MQPFVMLEKIRLPAPQPEASASAGSASRPYRCDVCQARFTAKQTLLVHMRRHTGEKPFGCSHCPNTFRHRSALADHERSHTARPYKCPGCSRCFSHSKTLISHVKDVHQCSRLHACANCNAHFMSASALSKHVGHKHKKYTQLVQPELLQPQVQAPPQDQEPPQPEEVGVEKKGAGCTVCYVCDREFSSSQAMWAHVRCHMSGNAFRCRLCPATFPSGLSLRSHLRVHTKPLAHKCKQCNLRFASRSSLWAHLKTHDRQQAGNLLFRCSRCLERFVGRKSLWAHLKTHKTPEPADPAPAAAPVDAGPKVYRCPACPRVVGTYNGLRYHRKHACTGTKKAALARNWKFKCSKCDERFKTRKKLYWHSQMHSVKTEVFEDAVQEQEQELEDENAMQDTEMDSATHSVFLNHTSPSKGREFRCGKCSQPFPDRKTLHAHSKTHFGAMVVMSTDGASGLEVDPLQDLSIPSDRSDTPVSASTSKKSKGVKGKGVYRCSKCPEYFRSWKSHRLHYKSHSTASSFVVQDHELRDEGTVAVTKYRCRKCPEVFGDKKSQMVHHDQVHALNAVIKTESGEKPKKYRCVKCPDIFPDKKSHWTHFKVHMNAEEMVYDLIDLDPCNVSTGPSREVMFQCKKCPEIFADRLSHWWHFKVHIDNLKLEETYEEVGGMEEIRNHFDPLAKYYRCSKCPEIFADEDLHWRHFREHLTMFDSSTEPYKENVLMDTSQQMDNESRNSGCYRCRKCSETFPDERTHWMHYRIHIDIVNPVCRTYDVLKHTYGELGSSILKQYRCRKCEEVFLDLESHWWHYRKHSNEEFENDTTGSTSQAAVGYKCKKCQEEFRNKNMFWWHQRSHITDISECLEVVNDTEGREVSQPGAEIVEYRCVKCADVFKDLDSHWWHYRTHYNPDERGLDLLDDEKQCSRTEKQYICIKCPEIFPDIASHWQHFRSHYQEGQPCEEVDMAVTESKSFRCLKCGQLSADVESHWWHYKVHAHWDEAEEQQFEEVTDRPKFIGVRCLSCPEVFGDVDSHWWHYREHYTEGVLEVCEEVEPKPKAFPCNKCSEVFPDRRSRFLHSAAHVTPRGAAVKEVEEPQVVVEGTRGYQCRSCLEIFLDKQSHWWHYKTVHCPDAETVGPDTYEIVDLTDNPEEVTDKKKSLHCSKCPEVFTDRKSHWWHYRRAHGLGAGVREAFDVQEVQEERRGYRCSRCTEVFPDRKTHLAHWKAAHANESASEPTASPDLGPEEERLRAYHCSKCTEIFPDKKAYAAHYNAVHSDVMEVEAEEKCRSYNCSKCAEVFTDRGAHRAHYKAVHVLKPAESAAVNGEEKARGFRCSKCPEVFPDRKSHWWHYRVHASTPETVAAEEVVEASKKKTNCSKCSEVFPDRRAHRAHYKAAHSDPAEEQVAVDEDSCDATSSEAAGRGKEVRCSKCPEVFPDRSSHWWHFRIHTDPEFTASLTEDIPEEPPRYQCSKCPEEFADRRSRSAHYKTHDSEAGGEAKPGPKPGPKPGARTGLKAGLKPAFQTSFKFGIKSGIKSDLKAGVRPGPASVKVKMAAAAKPGPASSKGKRVKCSRCSERFSNRKLLWAHFKQHRQQDSGSAEVDVKQGDVDEDDVKEDSVKEHGAKHEAVEEGAQQDSEDSDQESSVQEVSEDDDDAGSQFKAYKCNKCAEWFMGKVPLREHMKSHEEAAAAPSAPSAPSAARFLQCSKCPARFSARTVLWAHLKTHRKQPQAEATPKPPQVKAEPEEAADDDGDVKVSHCSKCSASFTSKLALAAHQRVHATVRPFKCAHCDARFTLAANMHRHTKSQHLRVPFRCRYCRQTFSSAARRKQHVRDVHPPEAAEV